MEKISRKRFLASEIMKILEHSWREDKVCTHPHSAPGGFLIFLGGDFFPPFTFLNTAQLSSPAQQPAPIDAWGRPCATLARCATQQLALTFFFFYLHYAVTLPITRCLSSQSVHILLLRLQTPGQSGVATRVGVDSKIVTSLTPTTSSEAESIVAKSKRTSGHSL